MSVKMKDVKGLLMENEAIEALRYLAYERNPIGEKIIDMVSESCQQKVINALHNSDLQVEVAIDLDREKLAINLHKISGKSRGFYDWDKMPKWDREIFRLEADAIRSNLSELLVVVKEK